ncbi:SCO0607 family lipoprotein [Streptomyces sp. NPDC050504]|uniref:SCO0607 family lipoprotein n=1 Tax=Streptomyces sp. NPDC050504 TaxID=3365618 RepID=UPI0037B81819
MPTPLRTARPAALLAIALFGAAALTGCSGLEFKDAVCGNDAYPVLAVNSTGSDCTPKGEEPAPGYARYPEGKVPKEVDDEWDVYWRSHTLDEKGNIIDAPDEG